MPNPFNVITSVLKTNKTPKHGKQKVVEWVCVERVSQRAACGCCLPYDALWDEFIIAISIGLCPFKSVIP